MTARAGNLYKEGVPLSTARRVLSTLFLRFLLSVKEPQTGAHRADQAGAKVLQLTETLSEVLSKSWHRTTLSGFTIRKRIRRERRRSAQQHPEQSAGTTLVRPLGPAF
jgi:hypothetical protein